MPLHVVTLNTWKNDGDYARRLPLMRDGLAAMAPDVVCLQECFAAPRRPDGGPDEAPEGGADTAAWLAAALGMTLHAAPARGKPRRHAGREVFSTSGLAILARGEAVAEGRLALTGDPADGERIAQRLDLVAKGRPLRVVNLHLTHLRGAAALRALQLREALAWAEDGLEGGLVIAGDLNATAEDPALAPLGLTPRPGTLHGARAGAPSPTRGLAIDHCVLLRPGAWREVGTLRGCETPDSEGWFPSDHAAVGLGLG